MTVKETIEMYKGKYDIVEIYVGDGLHTDSYDLYEPEQGKDYKAESWALMNCEDKKILCILISRESIEMGEEKGREAVKELNMTRAEELKEIMIAVINGGYSEEDFTVFKAEYGWADWMIDYVENEEITESESREIDEILEEGFRMAFDETERELYLGKQLVDRKEKNMKQIFITEGRERNIARFCEQKNCNQKDAVATTEEDFARRLNQKDKLFNAEAFIEGLKNSPFADWVQYD